MHQRVPWKKRKRRTNGVVNLPLVVSRPIALLESSVRMKSPLCLLSELPSFIHHHHFLFTSFTPSTHRLLCPLSFLIRLSLSTLHLPVCMYSIHTIHKSTYEFTRSPLVIISFIFCLFIVLPFAINDHYYLFYSNLISHQYVQYSASSVKNISN